MLIELLREARDSGVELFVDNGDLKLRASRNALKDELRERIRAHKSGLVELLVKLGQSQIALSREAPIAPRDRSQPAPLGYAQQKLWFLDRLDDTAGSAYNVHVALRLSGRLDRAALVAALDGVVARHEILRTRFVETDGVPSQSIAPAEAFALDELDYTDLAPAERDAALDALNARAARTTFDLAAGPPIRGSLVRLGADEHALVVTQHHIVSDAWSIGILVREVGALYAAAVDGRASPLPPLPLQYADYATWQRGWLKDDVLRKQTQFWQAQLDGAPPLVSLPTDRPRPARQSYAGASVAVALPRALAASLRTLARRHDASLFMVLLAGWSALLWRWTGDDDIVVGTPVANRPRVELEALIGFFVNTLALRTSFAQGMTVAELVAQVKATTLAAYSHQDLPFEQVVEAVQPARSLAHSPLFQTLFTLNNTPASGAQALPQLRVSPLETPHTTTHFDLMLALSDNGDTIAGTLKFATALFDAASIERLSAGFVALLRGLVADDAARVATLPLFDTDERTRLVALGRGVDSTRGRDRALSATIAAAAGKASDTIAVCDARGRVLTHAQLQQRANRLAQYLAEQGVGAGQRVGIVVERSAELLVGLLGVLATGAAYVPLDPQQGKARLAEIASDAGLAWILVSSARSGEVPVAGIDLVMLDDALDADWLSDYPDTAPVVPALTDPAYVIYTSGSTGKPKGVAIAQRGLADYCAFAHRHYWRDDLAGALVVTSPAFDLTVPSLYLPLVAGRIVDLLPDDGELDALALRLGADNDAWLLRMTPSHVQALLALLPAGTGAASHVFVIGGEAFAPALAAALQARFPRATIWNHYGPTETVVGCALHRYDAQRDADGARLPVGRPMENTRLYVLDAEREPVPVGVAGELYIGGDGVALGYPGRDELTAQKFVDDPFRPGERVYRSGDAMRWRADGELEFVGRIDDQVKLRGLRIEPGEIEHRLRHIDGVADAAVVVQGEEAQRRLVGYVVANDAAAAPDFVDRLRTQLRANLPEYMVPAAFVLLPVLPLTRNGKLDRRALPLPEAAERRETEAPQGHVEATLARLFGELLGVAEVGRKDHFFDLGGHSLLAVQLIARLRRDLGIELALRDVFAQPTLEGLARLAERADGSRAPALERADRDAPLPLSWAQQRLWFLDQLDPAASLAYHMPIALRINGDLDAAAMCRALDAVVARHESLRTRFVEVDGTPLQRIAPADIGFDLQQSDLSHLLNVSRECEVAAIAAREARAPFDLASGPPIRGRLLRLAADEHVLLVTQHHIVSDGWSVGVLVREVVALYAAFAAGRPDPLPPLALQYADFAAWQRRWIQGDELQRQAQWWRGHLAGAPALLDLATDRPRPALQRYAGSRLAVELPAALAARLRAASQRHGTTLFMTLLAGWSLLLSRLSGQNDVVVGTPVANRQRAEIEPLIGFFVNTLALRTRIAPGMRVRELLAAVKAATLDAYAHQDLPFEQVVEAVQPARSLSHSPLFQVMLSFNNTPGGDVEPVSGLRVTALGTAHTTTHFDLMLALAERGDTIAGGVEYATDLYDTATIEQIVDSYTQLLEAMLADDEADVAQLPLVAARQRQRLDVLNATAVTHTGAASIAQRFAAQAARTPDAVALIFDDAQLSYAQLDAQANRLAHRLRALGVARDVRVAVCLDRGFDLVVAVLAVLKAGGAYVPLDPAYPRERLAYQAGDCAPRVLIATRELAAGLVADDVAVLHLDDADVQAALAQESVQAPDVDIASTDLAYVIYTSGSTGRPKGVAMPHAPLANLIDWHASERSALATPERSLQFAALGFDVAFQEIFTTLCSGASLVLVRDAVRRDPAELVRHLARHGIERVFVPFVALQDLADAALQANEPLPALRNIVTAGEQLRISPTIAAFMRATPGRRLHNHYGPTESHVVTALTLDGDPAHWPALPPIGRPIDNATIDILDAHGQPLPPGAVGEIHIGGAALARGYLDRAELTAQRFVGDGAARRYRTGDLGRWRNDGTIDYLGRNDHQVKLRGFRVELGEIEARLAACAGVREAAVLLREDRPGDRRLVAYLVAHDGVAVDADALRAALAADLPEYMLPSATCVLDAFPLSPNGKLDRGALPAVAVVRDESAYVAPRTPTESALAALWTVLLGVERVGAHDDFFALGGHSLIAVKLLHAVQREFGQRLPLASVFGAPTLAAMAAAIDARRGAPGLVVTLRAGEGRPLVCVHPVGGQIGFYRELAASLPAGIPVLAVQSHAAAELTERPRSLHALAQTYAEAIRTAQPQGAYTLVGWSTGGAFALAVAEALEARGAVVDVVGLIDAHLTQYAQVGQEDALLRAAVATLATLRGKAVDGAELAAAGAAMRKRGLDVEGLFDPARGDVARPVLKMLLGDAFDAETLTFLARQVEATREELALLSGFAAPTLAATTRLLRAKDVRGADHYSMLRAPYVEKVAAWVAAQRNGRA
jgi:amino acid adenylation domain-containing protein